MIKSLLHQTSSETCSRLEALHKELAAVDQGNAALVTSGQSPICKQLYSLLTSSLVQKDKHLKILTCCCLSDIFKICAPGITINLTKDSPFSKSELLTIYKDFFKLITMVKDAKSPLFSLYYYLLEGFATYKAVTMIGKQFTDQVHRACEMNLRGGL
jgi:hypothetical protein